MNKEIEQNIHRLITLLDDKGFDVQSIFDKHIKIIRKSLEISWEFWSDLTTELSLDSKDISIRPTKLILKDENGNGFENYRFRPRKPYKNRKLLKNGDLNQNYSIQKITFEVKTKGSGKRQRTVSVDDGGILRIGEWKKVINTLKDLIEQDNSEFKKERQKRKNKIDKLEKAIKGNDIPTYKGRKFGQFGKHGYILKKNGKVHIEIKELDVDTAVELLNAITKKSKQL